jgi:hypothetical protein
MKFLNIIFFILIIFESYSQTTYDNVSIAIHDIKGYGEYEAFARESVKKLEEFLNSKEFENEFRNMRMTQTKRYDKTELLELIVSANEIRGNSESKNTMDIRLRVMSIEEDGADWMKNCVIASKAGTIGKEADKSGYTVTCKERIGIWAKNKNYGCMAGHIMHEYLHNLGFSHKFYSKRKSFVYKTGNIVRNSIQGSGNQCPTK